MTQPTDEEKKYRVESERGRVYEIALKDGKPHEISSLSEAKIYMAKDLANYEWCELKVYYEKMPSLLNQNLRRLVQRGRPFEAFVWPKDILRDLPKGREGYVTSRYSRVEFNKTLGEVTSPANLSKFSRAVRVKAMIELATAFEKIHWKGYCFPVIRKDTVLFDMKKGKVCICDCEYASPIGQDSITYNKQEELFIYRAPELALDKVKASQYSDRYTLAVMLFMLLTSRHPMEGKKRFSYNANGVMSKELAEELYVANPVFIFNEKDTSNCLDQKRDAAVIELWKEVPDKIKELFQKAFTLGLPEKGQYSNAKDRECRVRPSSKTWKEELQEWLKVLEDDSND